MAQFLVLAYDGTDADAPARRSTVRPVHLEGIKPMAENGEVFAGGPIFNESGTPVGSVLFAEFPSRADLDAWLDREPYAQQGVWQRIEVTPMRLVVRDGKVLG